MGGLLCAGPTAGTQGGHPASDGSPAKIAPAASAHPRVGLPATGEAACSTPAAREATGTSQQANARRRRGRRVPGAEEARRSAPFGGVRSDEHATSMPRTTHLLAALLALAAAAPLAAGEEEVLLKFKLQLTYESVRNFKNGFMVQAVSETLGVEASKVVVEFPSPPPTPPPPPPPPGALNATNTTNTTELANTTNTTESANTTNTTAEYDQPSAGFGRKLLQPREIVPGIELVVSVMVQTSNIKAFTDTLNKALFSETIQAKYEKLVFDSTQETILFNLALGESENYNQRAARDATATALGVALPRVVYVQMGRMLRRKIRPSKISFRTLHLR